MEHLSFSALNSWLRCSKAYELERIKKVPQIPAWWMLAGSAFHDATDIMDSNPQNTYSATLLARERLEHQAATKEASEGIQRDFFRKLKPEQGEDYYVDQIRDWLKLYMQWDRFRTAAMIEESIEEHFDFSQLPFRGYIDRVYDDLIVDLKTGSSLPPTGGMQLGFYRAGLLAKYGEAPDWGCYYKAREGKLSKPYDLRIWEPDYAGKILDQLRRGVQNEVFIPQPSFSCNNCSVKNGCYTYGGELSQFYDTLHPDHEGSDNG